MGDRGAVKTTDMREDVVVYRPACEAHARIDAAEGLDVCKP